MGCRPSKHTALGDDDFENLLDGQATHHERKSAFALPEQSMSSPKIEGGGETVGGLETMDEFAAFDQCFPSSPFGKNDYTVGQTAGPTNNLMQPDRNQLVKNLSGHNVFDAKPSDCLLKDVSGHNFFNERDSSKQTESIKPLTELSGHNLLEEKSGALPEVEKQGPETSNDSSNLCNNPLELCDSNVFDLKQESATTMPLSGELTGRQDTEHDEDDDEDGEQSISADNDQLLIGKTTEDGAQYLELSFEFLDVDLNADKEKEKSTTASCAGSCISNGTSGTNNNRQERRRGKRKDPKSSYPTSITQKDPAKDADKTVDTVKLEDDEKSVNSAASKEKSRRKHHRKHRHSGSRKTGSSKNSTEDLSNSFQLEDANHVAGDDKQARASRLNDSKTSMSSKKRSKKDKKKSKKSSKKSKDDTKSKPADEPPSGELVSSSGELVPESVDDMDHLLDDAVEAELVVVDDMWMGKDSEDKGDQSASKLADGSNVRTVKLAVSMPGDNELFGKEVDSPDQDRGLLDIIDIDPWDREGSKYSNKAAMAAIEREPSACAEKHEFEAFGHKLYPFAMLCSIGASLEVVQLCYEKYPEAMNSKDPTVGTPLHYACAYAGSPEVVQWLIKKKSDQLREVDLLQRSPFHVACLYSARIEILRVLVAKLPKGLEAKDYESNTTLHVAAEHDAPADVLEYLARKNPEALSAKRKDGSTPLHLALECGADSDKIKALLKLNNDTLKIPNGKGQLPIHLCLLGPTVDAKTVKYLSKGYPEGLKIATNESETPHDISKRLGLESSIRSLVKC
uniref:Uncharacterized protein n=1 Tax=Amphora coffeiformis TaxID=265554 RepID=A0A7S3LC02_9STRA